MLAVPASPELDSGQGTQDSCKLVALQWTLWNAVSLHLYLQSTEISEREGTLAASHPMAQSTLRNTFMQHGLVYKPAKNL
jgi:hypothetical protein